MNYEKLHYGLYGDFSQHFSIYLQTISNRIITKKNFRSLGSGSKIHV